MSSSDSKIVGRYAPSPTGALHLGNVRTALLAWLHARIQGGQFLLRMDDLDQPRVVAGSAEQILKDLEWLGLDWDGGIVYQSERCDIYQEALQQLSRQRLVYPCFCSRKDIRQAASAPHARDGVYPGTCATLSDGMKSEKSKIKTPAYRVRVAGVQVKYSDACLGEQQDWLEQICGDFVIKRADNLFAYQLATAVDDMQQGITHIVRGADLLDSTSRQLHLMQQLNPGHPLPQYSHVPLMLDEHGHRMAKRDGSDSVQGWRMNGKSAEQLIGCLAASVNLIQKPSFISARDLLAEIDLKDWQQSFSC